MRLRPDPDRSRWQKVAAPVSQLHRAGADAGRRRPEDVEEQAELPRADEIFDRYGADALRWYFFANQPPWTSIRYNEQAIKDSIPEFLLRLWNVYSFFVIYANDRRVRSGRVIGRHGRSTVGGRARRGQDVSAVGRARRARPLDPERAASHDRHRDTAHGRVRQFRGLRRDHVVRQRLEQLVRAPQPESLLERRQDGSRQARRLLDALRVPADDGQSGGAVRAVSGRGDLAKSGRRGVRVASRESVHLCDFPVADAQAVDVPLSERMELVREIVSLGRAARMGAKLKVRQPLAKVEVILADRRHQAWLEEHGRWWRKS